MDLSIIIPYNNEGKNLPIIFTRIVQVFNRIKNEIGFKNFEILFIDDGSTDNGTGLLIETIQSTNCGDINLDISIYRFNENLGQSAALSLGFSKFKGKYVATIDADLQNDPEDLIPMIKILLEKNYDVVSGYRKNRNEGFRVKLSMVGNWLIRLISGYSVVDVGCSLKLYKSEIVKDIKLPYGYHRFLPIITRVDKHKILNYPVKHFNRIYGKSHYNYSRILWLLKNIMILPFLRKLDISKAKKMVKIFAFLSVFSVFVWPLYSYAITPLIFLTLILSIIYVKINNFIIFQETFKYIKYERVFHKLINCKCLVNV
ncbi:MAG: glycosyltransferase [Candidatus Calescibacterium sp.]|nr:glycosyltransferase [Candidatus Calescibacterium sp.]MCX7971824.1 glycosyltransferase [bacterium]MDW8194939.1 glycosyltransferase [Candidatus Calescibacterium sp.]